MFDFLADPQIWTGFLTLAVLEIVLGIDNLIFLSLVSEKLPAYQRPQARRIGLILALVMRIALLLGITWIIGLTAPIVALWDFTLSWRDVVLGGGGAFLIYKATVEIHNTVEGHDEMQAGGKSTSSFTSVIAQIVVLDMVFSLDSIITAVGLVNEVGIMIAAVMVAIVVMLVAAEPLAAFIHDHPTVKMLALSFLMLVGVALVADGAHFHIPRAYLYVAIAFSMLVEALNLLAAKRRAANRQAAQNKPDKDTNS